MRFTSKPLNPYSKIDYQIWKCKTHNCDWLKRYSAHLFYLTIIAALFIAFFYSKEINGIRWNENQIASCGIMDGKIIPLQWLVNSITLP